MATRRDDFSFSFTKVNQDGGAERVKGGGQFRILVLGDFSGRASRGVVEPQGIGARTPRAVDAENLDQVLAGFAPAVQMPVNDTSSLTLQFNAIEDFRPDALLQRVPALQALIQLRSQINDPSTRAAAIAALKKVTGTTATPAPASQPAESESEFEKMLDRPLPSAGSKNTSADALIANLVAGYGTPGDHPEQAEMLNLVESSLSAGLRALLRHPSFQALEAAWRGVEFLVSRLNTDEDLKIFMLDISREEIAADLAGERALDQTGLHKVLVEQTRAPGAVPFSLVVGDYDFDASPESVGLLARVGGVMQAAGISFVAGGSARIAGSRSFEDLAQASSWRAPDDLEAWDKLRESSSAGHIGLAAPRFLVRLPYGAKTDAVDAFPFEEMPEPDAEQYLWANGAFAVALLLGEAFLEGGWEGISPGNEVSDLPCHMAVVAGDKEMMPCAQAWLSDRVGSNLRGLGLIPLLSVRNAAAVAVAGIHSIARPAQPLAGAWA